MNINSLSSRFLLASVFFASAPVMASTCTPQSGGYTLSAGGLVVQRDMPVGSVIDNVKYGPNGLAYKCVTAQGEGSSAGIKSTLPYSQMINGVQVYSTNVPGLGIAIGMLSHSSSVNSGGGDPYPGVHNYTLFLGEAMPAPNGATGTNWMVDGWSSNPGDIFSYTFQPKVQFYKIGPIASGPMSGQIGAFIANSQAKATGTWAPDIPITLNGTITVLACSLKTAAIAFPIGDVQASRFGTSPGTIPDGAQSTQDLGLDCDAGANVNVTLRGTQNPDVSTTSVLALTGQGNSNVAKGVGVQLLYNQTPLVLNNRIVLKKSTGGPETFPLTARYYQTKNTVTAGKANASATLDLTYQ